MDNRTVLQLSDIDIASVKILVKSTAESQTRRKCPPGPSSGNASYVDFTKFILLNAIYCKNSREVKFPVKTIFPGCQISRDVNPGQSNFLGCKLFMEANFPRKSIFPDVNFLRKSTIPGSQLFRKVNFPKKLTFPGSQISLKFLGKPLFPGSQLSREVNFPGKLTFPGSQLSCKVNLS